MSRAAKRTFMMVVGTTKSEILNERWTQALELVLTSSSCVHVTPASLEMEIGIESSFGFEPWSFEYQRQ